MTTHLPTAHYPRFHLAFPVTDLGQARRFYGDFLGCAEGRSSDEWVDFDFHGHQIVAHKVAAGRDGRRHQPRRRPARARPAFRRDPGPAGVGGAGGQAVAAGTKFIVEPYVRFKGLPGEQATMFFLDPFGNALEFKAFGDINLLFAKNP